MKTIFHSVVALSLGALGTSPIIAAGLSLELHVDRQVYQQLSFQQSNPSLVNPVPYVNENRLDSRTTYGIRAGLELYQLQAWTFELTAGYEPKVATIITTNVYFQGNPYVGPFSANYDYHHASAGLYTECKAVVTCGLGIEYRFESASSGVTSTQFGRPWLRANLGVPLKLFPVDTHIGIEGNLALTTRRFDPLRNPNAVFTDQLQAMAPKSQIGLFANFRF